MKITKTTYKVLIHENGKPPREIEITTDRGIEWSMEQYGRNRHLLDWKVLESSDDVKNLLLG